MCRPAPVPAEAGSGAAPNLRPIPTALAVCRWDDGSAPRLIAAPPSTRPITPKRDPSRKLASSSWLSRGCRLEVEAAIVHVSSVRARIEGDGVAPSSECRPLEQDPAVVPARPDADPIDSVEDRTLAHLLREAAEGDPVSGGRAK